jgi:hypothetical protein
MSRRGTPGQAFWQFTVRLRDMEAPHKLAEDDHKELVCPACGSGMRLVHIVPRLGAHPELRSFRCTVCDEVVTSAED